MNWAAHDSLEPHESILCEYVHGRVDHSKSMDDVLLGRTVAGVELLFMSHSKSNTDRIQLRQDLYMIGRRLAMHIVR
jgi:hypothetical protein